MQANIATTTPDGIVVLLAPLPLVDTKSGPHTALTATAIHIAVIASDAQTSAVMCSSQCCRSGTECCETVDIVHPPFPAPRSHTHAGTSSANPRRERVRRAGS